MDESLGIHVIYDKSDILDRHDLMIRQDIDDEINNLKKEIETL